MNAFTILDVKWNFTDDGINKVSFVGNNIRVVFKKTSKFIENYPYGRNIPQELHNKLKDDFPEFFI